MRTRFLKTLGRAAVLGAVLALFLGSCDNPTNSPSAAEQAAGAFQAEQGAVLEKTALTVAISDEAAVNAALAAYGALDADAKALLTTEKTTLDGLKAKIEELKAAASAEESAGAFRTGHAGALGKTLDTVALSDEAAVEAALTEFATLGAEVKALLAAEKTTLDGLQTRIGELKAAATAAELAEAFKTGHTGALGKTVDTVALSDEAAVEAALTAYEALNAEVRALLEAEKTKLDALKTRIGELKATAESAATFKIDHAAILAKTADTVGLSDETAVNTALTAYEALGAAVKALLTVEKTKLDSLKTKIEELKAVEESAAAFKTGHAAILAKTAGAVGLSDEAAVEDALTEYETLPTAVKALLETEKTKLDELKTKIADLKTAAAFKTDHSAVLAKTVEDVETGDEDAVDAALAEYAGLSEGAKTLLAAEKTKLDNLKTEIEEQKAPEAAASFKTAHSAVLAITVDAVTTGNETAVNAALTAYNALSSAAKALLTAEKTRLDGLKAKIETLKTEAAVTTFKTAHGAVLAKTVDTVAIGDEDAVNNALAAHNLLSPAAKAQLTAEKTTLDSLKVKIEELKAEAAVVAAAESFKTAHSVVLAKTTATVTIEDETAVDAALADYDDLSDAAKALLDEEKETLDDLKTKIWELKPLVTDSVAELQAWLEAQETNDTDSPYSVTYTGIGTAPAIYAALDAGGKFVDLDLSGSSVAGFANGTEAGREKIVSLVLPDILITIPTGMMGSPTFQNFANLKLIRAPNATTLGDYIFTGPASLATVDLPKVTAIGMYAFNECAGLKTISLPKVEAIGNYAFYNCTGLETVSLPEATSIGGSAFNGCTGLETISLPKATAIGSSTFQFCDNLETAYLPAATTIGNYAFRRCVKLATVTLGATPPTVSTAIFRSAAATAKTITIKVPGNKLAVYQAAAIATGKTWADVTNKTNTAAGNFWDIDTNTQSNLTVNLVAIE